MITDTRSARRRRLSDHLHKCGPRCILEALIAVESGKTVDSVLADFERLPPEVYTATLYYYAAMADRYAA